MHQAGWPQLELKVLEGGKYIDNEKIRKALAQILQSFNEQGWRYRLFEAEIPNVNKTRMLPTIIVAVFIKAQNMSAVLHIIPPYFVPIQSLAAPSPQSVYIYACQGDDSGQVVVEAIRNIHFEVDVEFTTSKLEPEPEPYALESSGQKQLF